MTPLRELQRLFKAHLLEGDDRIAGQVVSCSRDDGDERLGVYAHAYRARLRDVLDEEFSGLRALVGAAESDAAFAALMDGYISAQPSRHPNIRWFGEGMAAWLAESPTTALHPEYAAMASLDWALSTRFDSANIDSIGATELATLTPEQWPALRLAISPTLLRLPLAWNVDAYRQAVDADSERPPLQSTPASIVAVWRKAFGVRHRRLEADEATALDIAVNDGSFGEICAALCDTNPLDQVAARAFYLLQRWFAAGWVVALSFDRRTDASPSGD